VKKKRDKIDGLFKDYFSSKGKADREMFMAKMVCASIEEPMMAYEMAPSRKEKIKCPDLSKLGAYIDDTLDKGESEALKGHIAGCKKCQDKVREAKAAVAEFEKGTLPEVPQAVSSEELIRLAKKQPRKK